jgi:hypothetical protein
MDEDLEEDLHMTEQKMPKPVYEPTPEERAEHQKHHTPYRAWCAKCVAGQGIDRAHRRVETLPELPLIEVYYAFMKSSVANDVMATVLVAIHRQTGYAFASVVKSKGVADEFAQRQFIKDLEEIGVFGACILRSDSESSIRAFLGGVARARGNVQTHLQTTPPGSPSSLGGCERYNRTFVGLVRTMLLQCQGYFGGPLAARHPVFRWLVRRANLLLNRFAEHRKYQNKTAYEVLYHQRYESQTFNFG